jgi:histidinol-phosphate phosphatase family protein
LDSKNEIPLNPLLPNPESTKVNPTVTQPTTNSAVILAGGLGTRLRAALPDRPKVLAPVAGRHFLAYLLDQIADAGLRDVILCTGYLGEQVSDVFGTRFRRLKLRYSQEAEPRGTAGALRDALPLLLNNGDGDNDGYDNDHDNDSDNDDVLVFNGDSYCQTDLAAFLQWHQRECSQASLVLAHVPDVSRFGSVEFDGQHRIQRFREKGSSGPGWINAGIYAISKRLIAGISNRAPVSIEHECFPAWIKIDNGIFAYPSSADARFLDIGTPNTLQAAQDFFLPASSRNGHARRCVLLDRDGTVIVERNYLRDPSEVELLPGASGALRQLRELGLSIVLVSNQSGITRGFFDEQQLGRIHERLRALLGDADVALDAIYYCPHLPEQGCNCRKPQPGMIERAAHDLGFDPRAAFVIGDKACDVDLGTRVGATTLLVRTGYGQETSSGGVKADHTVHDLAEAASVIARRVELDAGVNVN